MRKDICEVTDASGSPEDQSNGKRSQKVFLPNALGTRQLGLKLASEWLLETKKSHHHPNAMDFSPVLLLQGDLGAGKTSLVQGIGEGLGIREPITSPSFALSHQYQGCLAGRNTALFHLDLYRLDSSQMADELFIQEDEQANAIGALLAVEWPTRLSFLPTNSWQVKLDFYTLADQLGREALINR